MPAAANSQVEIIDAKLDTLVPAVADSQGSCTSQQSVSDLLREMKMATAVVSASAAAAAAISDSGNSDGADAGGGRSMNSRGMGDQRRQSATVPGDESRGGSGRDAGSNGTTPDKTIRKRNDEAMERDS